jgi:hypothetical protein
MAKTVFIRQILNLLAVASSAAFQYLMLMQIPRILLMICVAALGLNTLQAQKADTPEQAKARELLRKKMAELDSKQPASTSPTAAKPRQSPAPAGPASTAASSSVVGPADPTPMSPSAEARARAALRQKIATLDSQEATKSTGVTWASDPLASNLAQSPIPPAVSSAKEQKLSELLTLYRANVLSPEEYHKRRAAILAQP